MVQPILVPGVAFRKTFALSKPNGEVAATGYGKYLRMPLDKIADFNQTEQEWKVTKTEKDPEFMEL